MTPFQRRARELLHEAEPYLHKAAHHRMLSSTIRKKAKDYEFYIDGAWHDDRIITRKRVASIGKFLSKVSVWIAGGEKLDMILEDMQYFVEHE